MNYFGKISEKNFIHRNVFSFLLTKLSLWIEFQQPAKENRFVSLFANKSGKMFLQKAEREREKKGKI